MKTRSLGLALLFALIAAQSMGAAHTAQLISSTPDRKWESRAIPAPVAAAPEARFDIEVLPQEKEQTIDGFGGAFSEMGWRALATLDAAAREKVMKSIFDMREGCRFTICRVPMGASDFALAWYSADETPGDYAMAHFSIERDRQYLIPYIKSALACNPALKIWASPWSPPSWMKKNGHYAMKASDKYNDLPKAKSVPENGPTMFLTDKKTQAAYALYFEKFIKAYEAEGIHLFAVAPQNEYHSAQIFPSCLWSAADLNVFVRDYLGPRLKAAKLPVQIWFGTMERPWAGEIDTIMQDPKTRPFIAGVGFQWAGKDAIGPVHQKYPGMKLMQSEIECGDGKNTWAFAEHVYGLLQHYFDSGAGAQIYWNIVLDNKNISTWGWRQNSLVSIDPDTHEVFYNPEYYVMKHFSYFVEPGAHKVKLAGRRGSELAFVNPAGDVVIEANNPEKSEKHLAVKLGGEIVSVTLPAKSFNTIVVK